MPDTAAHKDVEIALETIAVPAMTATPATIPTVNNTREPEVDLPVTSSAGGEDDTSQPPFASTASFRKRKAPSAPLYIPEFNSKFKTVERLRPGYPLQQILTELSGGRAAEWQNQGIIILEGYMDWLLRDDPEVVEILRAEMEMYCYHGGGELYQCGGELVAMPMTIAEQAMKQDPGLYALAVACHPLQNPLLGCHPGLSVDTNCSEVSMNGDLRFERRRGGQIHGLKLRANWVGLSEDCWSMEGTDRSWGHLYWQQTMLVPHSGFPATVRLNPATALGGACVFARWWEEPQVIMEMGIVLGTDRAAADHFVAAAREKICAEIKRVYMDLMTLEMQCYGENSYFTKRNARECASILHSMRPKRPVGGEVEEAIVKRVRRE
jgi:hypothetical protein